MDLGLAASQRPGTTEPIIEIGKAQDQHMNKTKPPRTFLPWEELRGRLDEGPHFNTMRGTPYYRDAVYPQFSASEYARRYAALRAKMREHRLDAVIVPGGPSHWSFGGGMLWLTGHWEWHALACYVVVPLEGEPTLIYSMGGTHAEAVRRETAAALSDVRGSRSGQYAEVMAERIVELGLERGRIGLLEIDPRHRDYMPVNQYDTLRKRLPAAELVFTVGFIHELLSVHSAEELDCVRVAGKLCENAMQAMMARAKPGVTEYELRAAAGAAILEGGGDIDFLIIGTTSMADPAMVFGNPRPSGRKLARGDIINMEIAAGYRGYTAQIGSPICLGPPTDMVRTFWDDITLPAFRTWRPRSGPAHLSRPSGWPENSSARKACSPDRSMPTASTSSPTGLMSSPTAFTARHSNKCFAPAWCSWPSRTRLRRTAISASSLATPSS
jgi:Xaa-Pro aminopeptidase